jgi:pilus assembly protein CpaF
MNANWEVNPLRYYLELESVTDVLLNGPSNLWIDRGRGLERAKLPANVLDTESKVRDFAFQMAISADERLDEASPIVDCKLADGTRFNAIISPLVQCGALISLRVSSRDQFKFQDLVRSESIPYVLETVLPQLIRNRKTILIAGATSSGKTTFLKALIDLIPFDQRVICIEEFPEITAVDHPHFISLSARRKNAEGSGEITLEELVKVSLRMRPDRIILGECRGKEIKELLSAFNTGHSGGFSTLHANSVQSVPARLEAYGALAGLTPEALASQVISAVDLVFQMRKIGSARTLYQIGRFELVQGRLAVKVIMQHNQLGQIEYAQDFEQVIAELEN